ncbi:MAG: hypothetical protein IT438_15635 [Phycisphaerales bacterium]|nr:hypothetical protein [Phycisphaerales bacterium]
MQNAPWTSKVRRFGRMSGLVSGVVLSAAAIGAPSVYNAEPEKITEDGVIAGTMDIQFNTRTSKDTSGDLREDSPAVGVKDRYSFSLSVVKTTEYSGEITRQPNLFTKTLGRKKQDAQLFYKVDLAVLNPKDTKQKKNVGRWVGTVPIDTASGAFDLSGGAKSESQLRINVDAVGKAAAFVDNFAGRLVGKAEKKDNLASYHYKRIIGGKTVEVKVKKSDPMRFENLVLAKGPSENYPRTIVNGRLDYDYETGNYFADNIRFKYSLDGADYEDIVTGTIKWVEDPDRKSNGKGFYDFNIRFNEEKNTSASSEGAAFEKLSDEDAFFAVDNSVPCLTGRVTYADVIPAGQDLPTSSKVTYALNANKLTKQQVMNFFKLWLVAIGPTNDE